MRKNYDCICIGCFRQRKYDCELNEWWKDVKKAHKRVLSYSFGHTLMFHKADVGAFCANQDPFRAERRLPYQLKPAFFT